MKKLLFAVAVVSIALQSCTGSSTTTTATSKDSLTDSAKIAIAQKAYVYGTALVLMDITKKKLTNYVAPADGTGAPINQFSSSTKFPDAKFKDVVRPNADTYYHTAMLDLDTTALVLVVPDTKGRFYLLPMLDAFGNVFASPGKRTTGTGADTFLIEGPTFKGAVPAGIKEIKAPTATVWILGRVQVNNAADGAAVVVPIEKAITLTPLSAWGTAYTAPKGTYDSTLSKLSPNEQLANLPIDSFFNYVNQLLIANPSAAYDTTAIAEFAKIGVGAGLKFNLSSFDTTTQAAFNAISGKVIGTIKNAVSKGIVLPVNGWSVAFKNFGNYGTDYNLRAAVDYLGLGANLPEDAIYPSCAVDSAGALLNGANKYVLHFEKGQTPPVNAFWSLTMYDEAGYFVENPINLYAIGNRSPLKYNADSSLDIYIQNVTPGKDKQNNWLPAPTGSFNVMLRLYWPKQEMLDGNWTPPAVVKVN